MPVLYSDLLLDHFRHPRNYGSLEAPDLSHEALNPLCGDRIRIELRIEGEIVTEARFKGDGCAISMAAASLLTELIIGKTMISDDELISALQSDIQPSRVQCAVLPLTALRHALEHR
jgi:nitrogen fixation NifU-like protein